jgi:fimbrial chaperone protein
MKTLLLLSFLVSGQAWAFRLDPMVLSIPVKGPSASGTFTVENNTQEQVAVQFEVRGREMDENGNEERPESKGFSIYPEQAAIKPGDKRSVRITWQGDAAPDKELPFRFVASQLPVNFQGKEKSQKANIKFLIEYVASLYLTPPHASPKMKVLSQKVNGHELEVVVANEGSAHYLFENTGLSVTAGGKNLKIGKAFLNTLHSENVLPGGRRILKIPLPKESASGAHATFRF